MHTKTLREYSLLYALVVFFCVGCRNHSTTTIESAIYNENQSDISVALDLAIKHINKAEGLKKPFELDAWLNDSGEWVFRFVYLPKAPDYETMIRIGTNQIRSAKGL